MSEVAKTCGLCARCSGGVLGGFCSYTKGTVGNMDVACSEFVGGLRYQCALEAQAQREDHEALVAACTLLGLPGDAKGGQILEAVRGLVQGRTA